MTIITIREWNKLRKTAELIQRAQIVGMRLLPLIIKTSDGIFLAADIEERPNQKAIVRTWTPTKEEYSV